MRRVLLLMCSGLVWSGVMCSGSGALRAAGPMPGGCGPAIGAAERAQGTAPGLLGAIGLVESGRTEPRTGRRSPWPWTVTSQGVGTFYPGKAEAIGAVEALRARGVASIDVGCMQVNLMHHPRAFRDLEEAFDPGANAAYAARFLAGLHRRLGGWQAAAEGYHSMTPEIGARYGRLIAAVWGGAPVPVVAGPGGVEVVVFRDGGQLRLLRDVTGGAGGDVAGGAGGRVLGYLP